jgi:WD40 repeat protein
MFCGIRNYNGCSEKLVSEENIASNDENITQITSVAFSPNGKLLASGSCDNQSDYIKLWKWSPEMLTLIETREFETEYEDSCLRDKVKILLSPNGNYLASIRLNVDSRRHRLLELWKINSDQELESIELPEEISGAFSVAFSADSSRLAIANGTECITIWDLENNAILPNKSCNNGLTGSIYGDRGIYHLLAVPNKDELIVARDNGEVECLNFSGEPCSSPLVKLSLDKHESIMDISSDGLLLATVRNTKETETNEKKIKLWHLENGNLIQTLESHTDAVWDVTFSPDGRTIASASRDNSIRLWGVNTEAESVQAGGDFNDTSTDTYKRDVSVGETHKCVNDISLDPSSRKLAVAFEKKFKGEDKNTNNSLELISSYLLGTRCATYLPSKDESPFIRLYDLNKRESIEQFMGMSFINNVQFSPNGKLIAIAYNTGNFQILELSTGQTISQAKHGEKMISTIRVSPDGSKIATASHDNTVKLWKTQDGKLIHTFAGHINEVNAVEFSPDGKLIASASKDNTIKIWNTEGDLVDSVGTSDGGHTDSITSMSFSTNGKILASGGRDTDVKLWQVNDHGLNLLATLASHRGVLTDIKFSSDGTILATSGDDKTIHFWNLDEILNNSLATATATATIYHHEPISVIEFNYNRDQRELVYAGSNGVINWDMRMETLLKSGCDWLSDYFAYQNLNDDQKRISELCKSSYGVS